MLVPSSSEIGPVPAAAIGTSADADLSGPIYKGVSGRYQAIGSLSRVVAEQIRVGVGLVIPFPPGQSVLGVVTSWSADPEGKVCFGRGASGLFCLGRELTKGGFVGLKIGEDIAVAEAEFATLTALKDVPNILQAIDFCRGETNSGEQVSCQVVEVAGLGNAKRLRDQIRSLDDSGLRRELQHHIAKGMLTGLHGMHAENRYHLDVKLDNVVISHEGRVIIIDVDCSQQCPSGEINAHQTSGDFRYFSPERWLASHADPDEAICSPGAIDAWSAGTALWEFARPLGYLPLKSEIEAILSVPFENLPAELQQELEGLETKSRRERLERYMALRLELESFPDDDYGAVVRGLLHFDPKERMNIGQALERLGVAGGQNDDTLARLKEMVQEHIFKSSSRTVVGPGSPQELPLLSGANHVARQSIDGRLEAALLSEAPVTVLQGGPGMGKTELATALLFRESVQDRFGIKLWFRNADNPAYLERQFIVLAQELGLARGGEASSVILPKIRDYLAQQDKPWLIIYDNADERQDLAPYLEFSGGQVLVTTRCGEWRDSISVGALTTQEARELASKALREETEGMDELLERLGQHPLAIGQACAYIRNRSCSIPDYLDLLRSAPETLAREERQNGHRELPYSIERLYDLIFGQLEEEKALLSFRLLTCLGPEEIPKELLKYFVGQRSRGLLKDYGLLRTSGSDSYAVHRLPRDILRETLRPGEMDVDPLAGGCAFVIDMIGGFLANRSGFAETPSGRSRLIPHLEALLAFLERVDPLPKSLREPMAKAMYFLVAAYFDSGQTQQAEPLLEPLEGLASDVFADDEEWLAGCMKLIGSVWSTLGHRAKAIQNYGTALALLEKHKGVEHPDALALQTSLGDEWLALGNPTKARELHETALECRRGRLGSNHYLVAESLRAMARVQVTVGRSGEALTHLEQATGIYKSYLRRRVLRVARSPAGASELERAEAQLELFYNRSTQRLNMATALKEQGDAHVDVAQYDRAIALYEDAAVFIQRGYGGTSVISGELLGALGVAWDAKGDSNKALPLLLEAHRSLRRQFGGDHPDLALTLSNLGTVYEHLGRKEQALQHHHHAIEILERVYWPTHPAIAPICLNLGAAHRAQNEHAEALRCYERGYSIARSSAALGEEHACTVALKQELEKASSAAAAEAVVISSPARLLKQLVNRVRHRGQAEAELQD